jgi:hypothetical protein
VLLGTLLLERCDSEDAEKDEKHVPDVEAHDAHVDEARDEEDRRRENHEEERNACDKDEGRCNHDDCSDNASLPSEELRGLTGAKVPNVGVRVHGASP